MNWSIHWLIVVSIQVSSMSAMNKWVSDHCLTPNEQLFSYIMGTTSYILMRWRCPLCTRPTRWVGLHSASSLKQQSTATHVTPLGTHYSNSEPTSLCSYSLVLRAQWRSNTYQFWSLVGPNLDSNPRTRYTTDTIYFSYDCENNTYNKTDCKMRDDRYVWNFTLEWTTLSNQVRLLANAAEFCIRHTHLRPRYLFGLSLSINRRSCRRGCTCNRGSAYLLTVLYGVK